MRDRLITAFPVLHWRLHVARQLTMMHPRQALSLAAQHAALCWLAVAAVSLATRWALPLQVLVALTLGVVVSLWRWTGLALVESHGQSVDAGPVPTERLAFRRPRRSDAADFAAAIDDETMRANGWTETIRRERVMRVRNCEKTPATDLTIITDRTTSELLGWISVQRADEAAGTCELGWSIAPHARRKGYATEAVASVVYALHQAGFRRVISGTNEQNHAARGVLEKTGAVLVETRTHTLPDGSAVPSVWYVYESPCHTEQPAETAAHAG